MKKDALLRETQRTRMLENAGLNQVQGANLITVDIQPEYAEYMGWEPYEYMEYLNDVFDTLGSLTFLYNGYDTLGMVAEWDYKMWLVEQGFEEENLDSSRFYDKGYAFFRYCMDEGMEEDDIVTLIQYLDSSGINDSRDINWEDFMTHYDIQTSEIRDMMEDSDEAFHVPELMDYLRNYGGRIVLTGGGIDQCLKEVELALMALNKPYNVNTQWTY